jgi:hypothetical protein
MRSLLSDPFTPQKYVHSSTRGSAEGGTPYARSGGAILQLGGSREAVFITHEDFTSQKYVHFSMRGSARGGTPSAGSGGAIPRVRGFKRVRSVNVYCNFIVNMDHSL